jgi:hypothetical protein
VQDALEGIGLGRIEDRLGVLGSVLLLGEAADPFVGRREDVGDRRKAGGTADAGETVGRLDGAQDVAEQVSLESCAR